MSVTIKKYSSKLIERFSQEKCRLSKFLPNYIKIEHVGSSAVYIGGKNIIGHTYRSPRTQGYDIHKKYFNKKWIF